MSWRGFKKRLNRISTSIKQKSGIIEKTNDVVFEENYNDFNNLVALVRLITQSSTAYLNSIRSISSAQLELCQLFDQFKKMEQSMPKNTDSHNVKDSTSTFYLYNRYMTVYKIVINKYLDLIQLSFLTCEC